MSSTPVVTVTVEVAADLPTAFEIFTEAIGRWWRPGPMTRKSAAGGVGMSIGPRDGGRGSEVQDGAAGEGFEHGRVLVWEPGARLVLHYEDRGHDIDGTEVEVRFEPVDGGTRVTLEHRGWEKVAADLAAQKRRSKRWGWANILGWYQEWAYWGSPRRIPGGVRAH